MTSFSAPTVTNYPLNGSFHYYFSLFFFEFAAKSEYFYKLVEVRQLRPQLVLHSLGSVYALMS